MIDWEGMGISLLGLYFWGGGFGRAMFGTVGMALGEAWFPEDGREQCSEAESLI